MSIDTAPDPLATDDAPAPGALGEQPPAAAAWWRPVALVAVVVALVSAGYGGVVLTIAVLLAMITIHEAGHFLAAKACKIKASEFFVGFGPRVFSFRRGDTEYGMKALFLGGYVKIVGMNETDRDDPDGYGQAKRWKRAIVIIAGPAMNIATALVAAFVLLAVVGVPTDTTNTIDLVVDGSTAQAAGLRSDDTIVSVDGVAVTNFAELANRIDTGTGALDLVVERDGSTLELTVPLGGTPDDPRIGISGRSGSAETLPAGEALAETFSTVADISKRSFRSMGGLVTGLGDTFNGLTGDEVAPENRPVSPVGAVQIGVEIGGRSTADALWLVMSYSIFLAVFNLLPIPPLDGGHLAVNAYEAVASKIRRRPMVANQKVVGRISMVFVMFILAIGITALLLDLTQPIMG